MNTLQRSWGRWLLLILSLAGIGIAIYLTTVHYAKVPLICSAQGLVNCERVTSSAYSVVPGTTIPITIPGLAWFVVSAALAIIGLRWRQRMISILALLWSILGMLTVLYLVYVELVLLHTICIWCTAVHIIIFVSLLITIVEVYLSGRDEESEVEDVEDPVAARR